MKQRDTLKIAITKIAPLIELIKKKGIDVNIFLSDAGLDADILNSPDNKITLEKYHALFTKGASLTNDRFFGLHAGESFTMMSNILGYLMMNCTNTGEALRKYTQYQQLTEDIKKFDIIQNKNNIIIEISIKDDELDRDMHLVDYNLSGFVSYWRALTGKQFPAIETSFRHQGTFDISEYARIFKSRLTFRAEKNAFVVPKESTAIPILQPNEELLLYFEKHINDILKRVSIEETLTDKVRKNLIKSIKGDVPSIVEISKHFSMSVRSLQNKLNDEDTTYSAILNSLRKEMAIEYLKDKNVTIAEISFLLGFSEPSAFHRSFKKWTNATPNMFR